MCKQILKSTAIVALILINGASLAASKKSVERNTNPSQSTFSSNGGNGRVRATECGSSHSISAAVDQCQDKKFKNIQCKKKKSDSSVWECKGDKRD